MSTLESLEVINEIYEEAFRRTSLPAAQNHQIDLTAPGFFGANWGIAEANMHRQKWRWLSPLGHSTIFLRVDPACDYLAQIHIHTALPEVLDVLKITANDHPVPVGGMNWTDGKLYCWSIIPKSALREDGGFLRLTYGVDFDKLKEAAPALTDRRKLIAFSNISVSAT
jgi:hypothetical protein